MKLFKKKDKNIEADEALAKNAESAKRSQMEKQPQMAKMPVQHRKQKRMSLRQSFVPSVARLCSNQL